MGTLYLDRKETEVRHDNGALILVREGKRHGSVPLSLLDRVVVSASGTLTTGALGALGEQGIGLVVLGGKGGRRAAVMPGRAHADIRRRIEQYRWYLDPGKRVHAARAIVAAKLRGQKRLLLEAQAQRPDLRKALTDAVASIEKALTSLGPQHPADRLTVASIRGIEGAAAAAYFRAFSALFAPSLGFTQRTRRPPRDPVNACLSLGYTLLHADAVLACHGAGLEPLLGLYHEPAFGRESLACDLIEPLRAHIDRWVWERFRKRDLGIEHFSVASDGCLLKKQGRRIFFTEFETFAQPLRRLLRRQAGAWTRVLSDTSCALDAHGQWPHDEP